MSKTLNLLLASAALTAVIGVPAWSAMHAPSQGEGLSPLTALFGSGDGTRPLVLVEDEDDDEDDDEDEGARNSRGDDDDDDDDDDEEDCDDDEAGCGTSAARQPAPAGSVPPPQNGLFGTGTPQVKVK